MKRRSKAKEAPRRDRHQDRDVVVEEKFTRERTPPPIQPKTEKQADYLAALKSSDQVVSIGPAGTGKTWIAATYAADLLRTRKISKIVITRPNVPCGRSLGFFPGTLEEKFTPWCIPVMEAIGDRMGRGALEIAIKRGDIEMAPFETIRGRTFRDAFVLLDEAQNTTVSEMKVFLTRIGEGTKVVIDGDAAQTDLRETSGLRAVIGMIKRQMLPVPLIEFDRGDIVRSDITRMWIEAFDDEGF